ncbi:hypothetical protein THII_2906 [Thioploca ingrica]|uniref:DUF2279 domain-containing protein n=1 Tax=Thioploca ingrica TaxID=40754 RepID=A0A090AG79_9GAMM|nr:hypothetical protein THII_2906 [Thioploca ingrica]
MINYQNGFLFKILLGLFSFMMVTIANADSISRYHHRENNFSINNSLNLFQPLGLTSSSPTGSEESPSSSSPSSMTSTQTKRLIAGLLLGTTIYGYSTWWKHSNSQFRIRHEGWFGADTPNGGADKLGHAYSFYVSTRIMTKSFQWAGHSQPQAIQLAGITSAALSVGVEVLDGFTKKYGFSPEDVVMNLTGIGTGIILENYPYWDNLFDLRLKYWPSDDARRLNEYDPFTDYTGQTYLLITKASGILPLRQKKWLRYLELAVGYGTRGYQPTDGTNSQPKERNFYYGLSFNLSQLFNEVLFKQNPTSSYTQLVTEQVLEYLQMPGTALLFDNSLK